MGDAYYSVGWRLDGRGRPADGWGPWQKVPGWGFHENQGGAVDLIDLDGDGALDLVVLAVDNPAGLNTGFVRVVPVETDLATAAAQGVWRILEIDSGVLAVHAALLHTGGGSGRSPVMCGGFGHRMPDDEYGDIVLGGGEPDKSPHDVDAYRLGRVGGHRVAELLDVVVDDDVSPLDQPVGVQAEYGVGRQRHVGAVSRVFGLDAQW